MNVIAIETATTACAIALRVSSGEEFEAVLDDQRRHTEVLVPGIRDLLTAVGLRAKDLDRVVVDRGPGLYTGLRVGVATAIGLSLGAEAALVSVTSLELLAHGAQRLAVRGQFVAVVDGRRGELFIQTCSLGEEVTTLGDPTLTTPEALCEEWARRGDPVTFAGDGVARYEAVFRQLTHATLLDLRVPPPREALGLGAAGPPEVAVAPMYLREADAIANFSTRERTP
ncbi:MAG: tRNA (adenosine(37)-N6)-threonylcarbamoyltransferase complex dimerization subunit type 1 TsaB [Acidimicrobiales bacterium]